MTSPAAWPTTQDGELDVGLIPSIEFFQRPDYTIVSDACIACRGPVLSVKLFSRVPLEQIRTLALDEGSRTSVALVRILLKERFGIDAAARTLAARSARSNDTSGRCRAVDRRSGDPFAAGTVRRGLGPGRRMVPLGRAAVCVCHVDRPRGQRSWQGIESRWREARDAGVAHLDEIADAKRPRSG